MKKIILSTLAIILFSCNHKPIVYPWSSLSFEEVLNLKTDKIIFLDFYSDNWGACKRLEVETLNNREIIDFTNEYLLPIKLDAWNDSVGQKLFEQFNGYAIPLLVFLNGKGEELDRVVGYRDSDEFLSILNNVLYNQDTFMSLYKQYQEGDSSSDLIDKLSIKSQERQDDTLSIELYNFVINNELIFDINVIERAKYFFAKKELEKDNTKDIMNFISNYKTSNNYTAAYMDLIRYYATKKDTLLEANAFKDMIIEVIESKHLTGSSLASFLNSYAWRMSELNTNLEDALKKSNESINIIDSMNIEIKERKPMLLDTKAEILWKMDDIEEAIVIINQSIELDSENQYYIDQKTKFINSKKGT